MTNIFRSTSFPRHNCPEKVRDVTIWLCRHPGESRGPSENDWQSRWIPLFNGMTTSRE
jgi:hypothetical protein